MLDTMRRNTKIILWVTVILFVLLIFLVWGADLQLGGGPRPNVAGEVNGERITLTDYQRILAQSRQNAQAQGRELTPTDEVYLEEQTWNNIVEEMLIRQEATHRGIKVRNAEVRTLLLNSPPPFITQDPSFRDTQGQFDLAAYQSFINNPSTPESFLLQLEQYVRQSLPSEKLRRLITAAPKVTEDELREAYADGKEQARVSYVLVPPTAQTPTEAPTDAQLEAYYKEHQEMYRSPRRAVLRYVLLPRVATAADSQSVLQDLREMAQRAQAAEASRLLGKEDLDNNDLATSAMTFSDLPSAEKGGCDSTWHPESQLSPGTRAAVAGKARGQIAEPYLEGGFGRLVQLADVKEEGGVRQVMLRELGIRLGPSDETAEEGRNRIEQVHTAALKKGLRGAAEEAKLTVQQTSPLAPGAMAPGLTVLPQAADFGQGHPPGAVSRVYTTNTAWVILEVAESVPEGILPLAEVHEQVLAAARREQQLEGAHAVAERLSARLSTQTLEAAAAAEGLSVSAPPAFSRRSGLPGLGREAGVIAAAFSAPVGQVSKPIRTPSGWAILRVEERLPADWTGFDAEKPNLIQSLLYQKQVRAYGAFVEDLKQKAKIEDYRS